MQKVKLVKLDPKAKKPVYATASSNAADIFACLDKSIALHPGEVALIPTGFSMEVPSGYGAYLLPRSGIGHKHGIVLGNLVGLIDTDYRGQVFVSLWNRNVPRAYPSPNDQAYFVINPGDRIAQMCIIETPQFEFEWADELSETARCQGGFGHTGV